MIIPSRPVTNKKGIYVGDEERGLRRSSGRDGRIYRLAVSILKKTDGAKVQVTGHRSGYRPQVTGHRSQVTGQVTGHRSHKKTIGHWTKMFWTDVLLYKNKTSQGTLMIFLSF